MSGAAPAAERSPIVQYLDNLQAEGGMKGTDIANVADVSKETISR